MATCRKLTAESQIEMQPVELKLTDPETLQITWSDQQVRRYRVRELRENCPCAFCQEKQSRPQPPALLPILKPEETQPLRIARMEPKGRYAYAIGFSDGHDTGIFPLELLRKIGTVVGG